MNAFGNARLVEAKGMSALAPFLREQSNGALIVLEKGPLARALQETIGDCIFQMPEGRAWSVEIKVEEDDKYGNLFLETWSNRNLEHRDSHIARGSNPGWFLKCQADLLFYYFVMQDKLYVFDLFKLKRWAFREGRIYSAEFKEKLQGKRLQQNDTWGRCVPIAILAREVGYRLLYPQQLPLAGFEGIFEAAE
jgi:hypothetical protein